MNNPQWTWPDRSEIMKMESETGKILRIIKQGTKALIIWLAILFSLVGFMLVVLYNHK